MDHGASFLQLNEVRAWVSAVVMSILVRPMQMRRIRKELTGRRGMQILVFSLAFGATNNLTFVAASRLPVAVAVTISYLAPVLVVVWLWARTRRTPGFAVLFGVTGAMVGVFMLSGGTSMAGAPGGPDLLGIACAGGAALAYGIVLVLGERLSRDIGAGTTTWLAYLVLSVLYLAWQVPHGLPGRLFTTEILPWVLFLSVFGTAMPYFLLNWGMRYVDVQIAAIVSMLEVVTAAAISYVALDQHLSALQFIGGGLVLAGAASTSIRLRAMSREV